MSMKFCQNNYCSIYILVEWQVGKLLTIYDANYCLYTNLKYKFVIN